MTKSQLQTTDLDVMRGLLAKMQAEQQQRLAETDAELKQREHAIQGLQTLIAQMEGPAVASPLPSVAAVPTLAVVATARKTKTKADRWADWERRRNPQPPQRPQRPRSQGKSGYRFSDHPFPTKVNVKEWAADHEVSYTYAKSWYAESKMRRPIPRKWALELQREFQIPLESWKNGITDTTFEGPNRLRHEAGKPIVRKRKR